MPRYVILSHDHPVLHWDFLLENGETCLTWRWLSEPNGHQEEIAAEKLVDHRLLYLDYEGPVSDNRGTVTRWDFGTFEWLQKRADLFAVRFEGQRGHGMIRVEQVSRDAWCAIRRLDP